MRFFFGVAVVCLIAFHEVTLAQVLSPPVTNEKEIIEDEIERYARLKENSAQAAADSSIDVAYYKLDLTITVSPNYVRGRVTVKAKSVANSLTSISLDLVNTMTVDSVQIENTAVQFTQHPTTVSITLNRSYGFGEMVVLDVFYRGVPVSTGFGSFEFGSHANTPWVWTLSEPYGAKDWWPCKDHPLDKADSVDIRVTCRNDFKVASNGSLKGIVNNPDSTHTYVWAERYPITTYLVFVSLTNYAEFTDWFRYSPTDSMPVVNYVLPENLADARDSMVKVIDMLHIFSDKFGLYPFINEKYGHAEFGRGGAMEHQTMTSLVRYAYGEYVLAHELGHQWFGDLITCANWQHVWLNEGFASYCEAIYSEDKYGVERYRSTMLAAMTTAKTGVGPVIKADTTVPRELFDDRTVYRKGASILHMLRHVLGDSVFFQCLRSYVEDPRYRFGVALTENFQEVCETVSGRQLGWFFSQWLYGENYPRYNYHWRAIPDTDGGFFAEISLSQTTGTSNPTNFTMPIDFRLSTTGWDTTVVLFNTSGEQQFRVWTSHQPTIIELDPENWILKDALLSGSETSSIPTEFTLKQNYPNPFNPVTTIEYDLPRAGFVVLQVFTVLGEEVRTLLNEKKDVGKHRVDFDASRLPSGVYFYRLTSRNYVATKPMVFIK